ncbi:hypothetical protein ACSMX9_03970 [Streptomyces sp. LE64]|jgi:hypothetical protein
MRRVTVQKTPSRTDTRRGRREDSDDPALVPVRERPEIRKDVRRAWWPEG